MLSNQSQIISKFETPKLVPPLQTRNQDYVPNGPSFAPQMSAKKSEMYAQEFEVHQMSQHTLAPMADSKVDLQCLVDWINSFDDSYCVLVNHLPDDISDGVVLSHLVGYLVCSQDDRQMIFDLLNYPDEQGRLHASKVKDNFDLAYNVLKCSETYIQNKDLQFLAEEDEDDGVNPMTMADGSTLVEFLRGL